MQEFQKEIQDLKVTLDDLNEKKEFWFTRKEDLKKVINSLIVEIKQIKEERDKKNIELQELKKERDKYNNEVQVLIEKIKKSNKEKANILNKYNIKVDPKRIQEKINQLESKIEIETNFEKEKKLMEEIKKLKKVYTESAELLKVLKESDSLDEEIRNTRKKADEFHKKIQEVAKDIGYDMFIELSNKITETKKIQEEAFQKFIDYKNQYSQTSQYLKGKFEMVNVIQTEKQHKREVKDKITQEKNARLLEEATKKVEEKLKTKKRLTTEDLWVMQANDNIGL